MMIETEFIVSGNVQGVGYRNFVAKIARKLKINGYAENLEDGTVRIQCKGKEEDNAHFRKAINVKHPDEAPLIDVEDIKESVLKAGTVDYNGFREKYNDHVSEMAQGFSTGMNYMNLFIKQTKEEFDVLNGKYHVISETMGKLVEQWEKEREFSQQRFEQNEKNIQELLKILLHKR